MHNQSQSTSSLYQKHGGKPLESSTDDVIPGSLPTSIKEMPAERSKTRASIGVNLRVTGHLEQGGRKYMEDYFGVAYQHTRDEKDLEYAFFGIFDGHGGAEAAAFAREHLMDFIVKDPRFWQDDDDAVLQSIKDGFIDTHHAMWKIHGSWPKTALGLPSTAGTTASIAFIRHSKIYIGHVGDSGITLGFQNPGCPDWQARSLTKDHKPENEDELARIEQSGGKVISKMGVPRVVWNRPRIGHKGPVRRSTPIDEIPFLAVARSLGDLWSYNATLDEFVVSPKPDVMVVPIDISTFKCLIFGTDGLYNMLSPQLAVRIVQEAEQRNEEETLRSNNPVWINPSRTLVERALDRWCNTKMRADNTSVITLLIDRPGPPRSQVLRNQREEIERQEREFEKQRLQGFNVQKTVPAETHKSVDMKSTPISTVGDCEDFVPNPRHSTAFDTRCSPTIEKDEAVVSTSRENADDDIQINEVTSSSLDAEKMALKKKTKSGSKKLNLIQRKFNLRSSNNQPKEQSSLVRTTRAPLGENVPETCRLSTLCESRVLRERRNTTPNINNGDNKVNKKKNTIKQISAKKKKALHNLLFKNKDAQPNTSESTSSAVPLVLRPKTKENNAKEPPNNKRTNNAAIHLTSSSSPPAVPSRRSDRTRQPEMVRKMRKSTLEQKLRTPEGIFKAKLRTKLSLNSAPSSKIKPKKKGKAIV